MPVFNNQLDAEIFIARHLCHLEDDCKKLGLSLTALARRIGLKLKPLCEYRDCKFLPSLHVYNSIALILGWRSVSLADNDTQKLRINHCYIFPDTENSIFRFRYEGFKDGIHSFREIHGNWTRSLSDAQLIGKIIQEVNS